MDCAFPLECVDRLKSKNIEMEDFTIRASIRPSHGWWGSVYVLFLVLGIDPALEEPTVQ